MVPTKAAVYARISSDPDGDALGVGRQLTDCHALADSLHWTIAEEYIDNDLSAYGAKRRPAYERLLDDLAAGIRDGVVVYHPDRLTRRPIELERFVEVVAQAGVRHIRFVTGGPVDLGDGDGLLVLRLLAAVAANESASKSRRVRRKLDEVASAGRPHGGSVRPFGYQPDRVTIRSDEAEIIRLVVHRFLAGESLRSLATWLGDQGVHTVRGGPWRTSTLKTIITSPRIAGLRQHRGEVIGPAAWDAIITLADRERVLARFQRLAATGRRSPRRYLLSGVVRCGKCGQRLYSSARQTTRRYVCLSGPDHGGCGGITVVAAPLEQLVADAVLYRLDTPELADALEGRAAEESEAAVLSDSLAADRQQLDELAELYASRQISRREWMAARGPIDSRIATAQRRLGHLTGSSALASAVGNGQQLREHWSSLNLTRQAAIVAAVLDHVIIAPGNPRANTFDPARADLVWRL